jgi:hypothetical protein
MARQFAAVGQPPPDRLPLFPPKPRPAGRPPYRRCKPSVDVRRAIAAAETREKPAA